MVSGNRARGFATCFILFLAALYLSSCAVNPVSGRHELMLMSEGDEIRLGRQIDPQIKRTYGVYDDAELNGYINDLGQRMARLSHRPGLAFEFKVMDSAVVNAFAVPGGYVYLTRGILSYINSEAELAGIVAHEIGHVTARHSAQQYTKAQLAGLGIGVASIFSETLYQLAGLVQFGVGVLFLKFSRDNEREADDLGVEYASRAGYDASRMADFFVTMDRLRPASGQDDLPTWLSTHPDPPDRIATIKAETEEWRQKLGLQDPKVDRDHYLQAIDGLVIGEDPRQGYVENGVFYHPDLRFQFPVPASWDLVNTPSQVGMISEREDAVMFLMLESGQSPREAAYGFVRGVRAKVVRSDEFVLNGFPCQFLISDVSSQQGVLRVMSYFIQKDNLIYGFHGLTARNRFRAYGRLFESTMGEFHELTDPDKINVEPDRIYIAPASTEGTVEEVLGSLGVPQDQWEETALLNGKTLGDMVPAGTSLKVIGR
jgi:predicted Zn-dependent protease